MDTLQSLFAEIKQRRLTMKLIYEPRDDLWRAGLMGQEERKVALWMEAHSIGSTPEIALRNALNAHSEEQV